MRLRFTDTALRQIEEVLDRLAEQSSQGYAGFRTRLASAFALLEAHPHADQATNRRGQRRFVLTPHPYVIFYRVTKDEVAVSRFRHAVRRSLKD